eukprot:CAMPEP_0206429780 /NCGR_PEP_ID=MMETSP0324_2-20121206/6433_1 /ASSEMBLY_ACC=CAM_ASM_000836 /TAXON_ID=2866 /ORGANISM="Crypthecodinium cohnii, Strain Seligo" /LENGTH=250 /DNA_ID=CAMNT_0053895503 /DNA_START=46 /DNA_END=798 /DNA_ORIENTATION=-
MSSLFVNKDEPMENDDRTYLSFNTDVTSRDDLGPKMPEEDLQLVEEFNPMLEHKWVLWEQHHQKSKEDKYHDATKEVCSFQSVKEFWNVWNFLPQPSELLLKNQIVRETEDGDIPVNCLAIFREGIQPQWEDPQNYNGGHFQLTIRYNLNPGLVDELWNNTVISMITGAMEHSDKLTGVRLVDKLDNKTKPHLRIELWFSDYDEETREGGQGEVFDLRGSFEKCLRTGLDGTDKKVSWGRTTCVDHRKEA